MNGTFCIFSGLLIHFCEGGDRVAIRLLKTAESLRLAAAQWLLVKDRHNVFCLGNELGERFLREYTLPPLDETLIETLVDEKENITLVFESKLRLSARDTVDGRPAAFPILRYVRALYDDSGNVYRYVTLGYKYQN